MENDTYTIEYELEGNTLNNPKYLSRVYILPYKDPGFVIASIEPMPNWWWRFWQWLLLGWRWEKVE